MTSDHAPLPAPHDLTFYSAGVRCAATFWPPEGESRVPGVLLCHGFRGIRAWFEPEIAELFQRAGFAALTFDYKGFGDSEGITGRLVPSEQVEDIRNALTLLANQPGVDPARLALFGTSFGGSNAVAAAAIDDRVAALACVVGIGDVSRAWRSARERLLPAIEKDRNERVRTGHGRGVDPATILDNHQSDTAFADAEKRFPGLCTEFPLDAVERIFEFAPERIAADISPRALLVIGAEIDHAVPTEESRRLYDTAAEPKRLIVLPAAHYDVYHSPVREQVVDECAEWFRSHLV